MVHQQIRKAPPPPSFNVKAPIPPKPKKPVDKVDIEDHTNIDEALQVAVIKNEEVEVSTFTKDLEIQLFDVFGEEVMASFITNRDRIGAAYVIMQSLINTHIKKNDKIKLIHTLSPVEMDNGITDEILKLIVADIKSYYQYFSEDTVFNKNKEIYKLANPVSLTFDKDEDIMIYMLELFKTISSLDNSNIVDDKNVLAPYESDMIKVNKMHHQKMWELAKQVKESIEERNAIIDEIAIPIIKKGFPVDARKLAANFLKESKAHPDIAVKALYENPATFAPILTDKLPRKMFGLVKASAQDAININKNLGRFLRKFVS